jgi:hypothetical protein
MGEAKLLIFKSPLEESGNFWLDRLALFMEGSRAVPDESPDFPAQVVEAGGYAAARERLLETLRERPGDAPTLRALGWVSARLWQTAPAIRYYHQAIATDPRDADAHFGLALLYLQHGNYAKGFIEYEWRLLRQNCIVPRYAVGAVWEGQPLRDERLMLHCEQGLGDAMQFIRFLPEVRRRVGKIVLACHPQLVRLFSGLEGLEAVVTDGDPLPECAFHCPLLSLPRIFRVTLETLPREVPYLPLSGRARQVGARSRVGLVWRANRASGNTLDRSASLADLRPLADEKVDWVSLQREVEPAEREMLRDVFRAEDLGDTFRDMRDTADCVQGLDGVVSVDTSVVHLAGALARPVFVLLPQWGDWRWMENRADSPWYPTARLFRQHVEGDWSGPVRAVGEELRRMAASNRK